jgi:hypothetical protein
VFLRLVIVVGGILRRERFSLPLLPPYYIVVAASPSVLWVVLRSGVEVGGEIIVGPAEVFRDVKVSL